LGFRRRAFDAQSFSGTARQTRFEKRRFAQNLRKQPSKRFILPQKKVDARGGACPTAHETPNASGFNDFNG
jgi:hypothetical protein